MNISKLLDKTILNDRLDGFYEILGKYKVMMNGIAICVSGFIIAPSLSTILPSDAHETISMVKYGLWGAGCMYMFIAKRSSDY